ncbi:MAG: HAMP domain-containing protein, partial [Actinobacteria bacterium]|nr:HAMP domain-containing protein [Actinomycetota bacterium]
MVVGASSEVREETLANLVAGFAVGGPVALGLVSLLGYALASAALRPVESMRRQAAAISASEPGKRLPVPAARDEIARLGETLNGMLARLETALARERSFVADASHELRTPLALMKAEFEPALKRTRSVEELEAALRSAAEETERLTQLAEDLLVLARSDQGDLPVRRELLSASELLGSVKERFARRAAAVGRRLEVETAPIDLSVDRLRAEQALGNLVENALRHGSGAIVLRASEQEGQVELHVLDEGPGFTEAYLPRAFERFSRGEAARSGSGAGLGLAIVDVIARAHGGSARAASSADGADVWLSLP